MHITLLYTDESACSDKGFAHFSHLLGDMSGSVKVMHFLFVYDQHKLQYLRDLKPCCLFKYLRGKRAVYLLWHKLIIYANSRCTAAQELIGST